MSADCEVNIQISGSKLSATLTLPSGSMPESIDLDALIGIVRDAGVLVNAQVRARLTELYYQLREQPDSEPHLIAEAKPPTHGADGWIEWNERFDPDRTIHSNPTSGARAGQSADDEAVDHYSTTHYQPVAAGEELGVLHPPTSGEDGYTVTGTIIAARPGSACQTEILDETIETTEDGRLIALAGGILQVEDHVASIVNVLTVTGHVDFSTGHIDFDGSVEVREGVRDKFRIRATRNVRIGGLVEAATIVCGGNLECQRGIAGRDRAQILVGRNATANFINNTRGKITGDLLVRRELMNCNLAVGGIVHADAATIIGGTLIMTHGLLISEIGSPGHAPTTIRIGSMPILAGRLRELEQEIAILTVSIQNAEHERSQLQARQYALDSEKARLSEVTAITEDLTQRLEAANEQRQQLRDRMRTLRGVPVRINRMLWGNTSFIIDRCRYQVRDDVRGPLTITWNPRRHLIYRIGESEYRPLTEIAAIVAEKDAERAA